MKRILVIGGTGFIGSHVVHEAILRDYDITVLSLKKNYFSIQLPSYRSVKIVNLDISKKGEVATRLKGDKFDYIINCGGYINHTLYANGGASIINQHLTGVMNIVSFIERSELQSFVQLGSSDEYGNVDAPQKEDLRESPISPYSFGKVATTHFLQMLHRTESFPATILRIFIAYGPGQDSQRFLPQIIKGCLQDRTFPVSLGEQLRDFCFVKDIVNGIFSVFYNSESHGEIINIASGTGTKISTIIEMVQDIVGSGNPDYGKIPYRKDENMFLYADVSKARSLLGWQPKITIKNGLKETIEFYKATER